MTVPRPDLLKLREAVIPVGLRFESYSGIDWNPGTGMDSASAPSRFSKIVIGHGAIIATDQLIAMIQITKIQNLTANTYDKMYFEEHMCNFTYLLCLVMAMYI